MTKDKLNPDRDEMPGGARIVDKSKQRGSRTASNTRNKPKAPQRNSEKRLKGPRLQSSSGRDDSERSEKTGKRSRAQKSRPTSVIGPA